MDVNFELGDYIIEWDDEKNKKIVKTRNKI